MSKSSQQKERRHWAIQKPKLDNTLKLMGIYCIEPDDVEFKDTMKNARKKSEVPLESAVPCKIDTKRGETRSTKRHLSEGKIRMYHRSPRVHENANWNDSIQNHKALIAEKGFNSMSHHNFAHNPFPIHQAMKISGAKAAVDKEWVKSSKSCQHSK